MKHNTARPNSIRTRQARAWFAYSQTWFAYSHRCFFKHRSACHHRATKFSALPAAATESKYHGLPDLHVHVISDRSGKKCVLSRRPSASWRLLPMLFWLVWQKLLVGDRYQSMGLLFFCGERDQGNLTVLTLSISAFGNCMCQPRCLIFVCANHAASFSPENCPTYHFFICAPKWELSGSPHWCDCCVCVSFLSRYINYFVTNITPPPPLSLSLFLSLSLSLTHSFTSTLSLCSSYAFSTSSSTFCFW